MKAEDTVMALEYSVLDSFHCKGVLNKKILKALKEQAEISFKAGIQEVVEWIISNNGVPDHILDLWQTKLKDWGIE